MKLPPAVVVHGLDHAKQAMAPGLPVTLLSAPGAATFAGCGWWRALVKAAGFGGPDVLDCGAAPGHAMAALRCLCRILVLDPAVPAWPLISARAAAAGAVLLPAPPPALDLHAHNADRRLLDWLRGPGDDSPARSG